MVFAAHPRRLAATIVLLAAASSVAGHGEGITADFVGDRQVLSNIDSPHRMQVSEYSWEQSWLEGRLRSVVGKIDANAEFAVVPVAGEFINSSFGFHRQSPCRRTPIRVRAWRCSGTRPNGFTWQGGMGRRT